MFSLLLDVTCVNFTNEQTKIKHKNLYALELNIIVIYINLFLLI